jgi:DNA-binding PadR family transcriptional regulator
MSLPASHLQILISLAAGDLHGYAIMAAARAGGAVLGPGALYAALGRLLDAGQIEELDERPAPELDDARRRYYRITAAGHGAMVAELDRLRAILDLARRAGVGQGHSRGLATGGAVG